MQQPETVQKMAELGATAVAVDSEPFAATIASETERWKKMNRGREYQDGVGARRVFEARAAAL